MEKNLRQDSLFSAIASVAAPLIQIIAVLSISLSDQMKLAEFFVKSEYLPLINFLIIFVIASIIGVLITRKDSYFGSKDPSTVTRILHKIFRLSDPESVWTNESSNQITLLTRLLWFAQIPSFFLFLSSIVLDINLAYRIIAL